MTTTDAIHFTEALAAIPGKYAQPDASTLALLPKPTKKDAQKGKCAECGGWHGLPAVHLAYMGHAEVNLALIEVDPLWTWEPLAVVDGVPVILKEQYRLVMWAKLTVLGKTIIGVGTCEATKGDPEKELIGDFLRNAAMRFGIGTKLWSKATDADPAGRADVTTSRPARAAAQTSRPPAPVEVSDGEPQRGTITDAQIKKMGATFTEQGIKERNERLAFIAATVEREIGSSKELSKEEAGKVIDALEALGPVAA